MFFLFFLFCHQYWFISEIHHFLHNVHSHLQFSFHDKIMTWTGDLTLFRLGFWIDLFFCKTCWESSLIELSNLSTLNLIAGTECLRKLPSQRYQFDIYPFYAPQADPDKPMYQISWPDKKLPTRSWYICQWRSVHFPVILLKIFGERGIQTRFCIYPQVS
jgi:hypothetical protein